jgi:hypothetical protein
LYRAIGSAIVHSGQRVTDASETAHEILSYLLDYSGAQDTLDGIVEWWLLERHIRYQISRVKEALADLVREGLVVEHRDRSVPTRYGINWDKVADIRKILEEGSAQTEKTARTGTRTDKNF